MFVLLKPSRPVYYKIAKNEALKMYFVFRSCNRRAAGSDPAVMFVAP
jgi:hypothetical protein